MFATSQSDTPSRDTMPVQKRFRSINEEILRQAEPRSRFTRLDFICECRDPHCFGVLPLSVARFRRLGSAPGTFVVVIGHATPSADVAAARAA